MIKDAGVPGSDHGSKNSEKDLVEEKEQIHTIVGPVNIDKDEHQRCVNCVRFRVSRATPGQGICTRTLFDEKGKYVGRANEEVAENYCCEQFLSKFGGQQQQQ